MRKIVIIGAGGFGREVQWLIERVDKQDKEWELAGYIDDAIPIGGMINGIPVLGGIEYLLNMKEKLSVVCAIGNSQTKKRVIGNIKGNTRLDFPNFIDPSVQMSESIRLGHGNIICAGSILTVDIDIKDFVTINLACTVGHDAVLNSYTTIYPSVNISGMTNIGRTVEIGTGSQIIQGIQIGEETIVGAGAVVAKDLPSRCTAVGVPAKPIKWGGGVFDGLLIVGAGGNGKVISDMVLESQIYKRVHFLDDNSEIQQNGIIGTSDFAIENKNDYDVVVSVGNCKIREKIQKKYEDAGVNIVTLIHPRAYVAADVEIGKGTVIMAEAVVQSGSKIGRGVIINTASTIDHDNIVGDFVHISPGAHFGGTVEVGNGTWIGTGAVVKNNTFVGAETVVGAGAAVVQDLMESSTYVGVPAKKIK